MNTQDPILLELLNTSGLKEKEARIYLALLSLGEANIQQIAKHTGLKRPIIYVLIEDLIKNGYVSEIPNLKIRTFRAIDPGAIEAHLRTAAKNFTEMLPIFKTLANTGIKKPRIAYFDTLEGIQKVFEEVNRHDHALFISSYIPIQKHLPHSVDKWIESYRKGYAKLNSKCLIPDNPKDIEIAKKFLAVTKKVEMKILPTMNNCALDLFLFANKCTITTFDEKPFMVVIESEAIPQFFNPIFEMLWRSAKPIA